MESTLENPVAFFESFIVNGGLESSKRKYIENIIENSSYIVSIDNTLGIIIEYIVDEKGITQEYTNNYNKELEKILRKEFNISKTLINETVITKNLLIDANKKLNYFTSIQNTIQYILNTRKNQIETFPILLKPLQGIIDYCNNKYLEEKKLLINTTHLEFTQESLNDHNLIIQILGYLKGENQKREKIITDQQFDLFFNLLKC